MMTLRNLGECKLCQQHKTLINSHIFPEFFYKSLYDEKHRAVYLTSNPGEKERYLQKGLREYMLCEECELRLSKYERYAADILRSLDSYPTIIDLYKNVTVDYKIFKLFQLSLLWRSGVSKREEFSQVALGPHEEILRDMILKEDPGMEYEYGCFMTTLKNRDDLDRISRYPIRQKFDGHRCYRFLFCGIFWMFIVSSHSHNHPSREFFLQESGLLHIMISDVDIDIFLAQIAKAMRKAGKI
jgi:hypothetical protein